MSGSMPSHLIGMSTDSIQLIYYQTVLKSCAPEGSQMSGSMPLRMPKNLPAAGRVEVAAHEREAHVSAHKVEGHGNGHRERDIWPTPLAKVCR